VSGAIVCVQPPEGVQEALFNAVVANIKRAGAVEVGVQKKETAMIDTWTEVYQRCLVDIEAEAYDGAERAAIGVVHCGSDNCKRRPISDPHACGCACTPCTALSAHMRPPMSAVARTVPLFPAGGFNDEYVDKKWRDAYERAVAELAPPLSPTLLAGIAEKRAAEDPDYIAPPKDDSESGFTQPDGTLILPDWAIAPVDPLAHRIAPGEAIPNPRMFMNGESSAAPPPPVATPTPTEKRGKGRPTGSKNKAPKEWKAAYTRAMAELTPTPSP
jgi:hypothetical protein